MSLTPSDAQTILEENFAAWVQALNLTVTEISTLLQFCNPAYFSRVFKKFAGKTPNAYRKSL